jgi:hypothetical protein
MVRILIIASALLLALNTPAVAQKKVTVEQVLTQLHGLCEGGYTPACFKLGLIVGRIPPKDANKLRSAHPEWFWWERW